MKKVLKSHVYILGRGYCLQPPEASCSGIVDLPKAQKIMEQNFDSGPGFWAMVQNGPEMAQNGKSLTTPTVFKV